MELEQIFSAAGVGFWKWDSTNDRIDYSPGFAGLLGSSADSLPATLGEWYGRIHRQDRDTLLRLLEPAAEATPPLQNIRLRAADGLWRWFAVKRADADSSSKLIVFRDITEQKQSEAALRDSQLRYRALYVTSPLACVQWNRQGSIAEWNARAEVLFGWKAEEVIGKSIHQLLLPAEDHESFRTSISALCQRKGDGSFSGVVSAKDRTLRCRWYNVALRKDDGSLLGILSLILDVSDEQIAIEKVAASEKTYRSLVETSPDGILLLNPDGTIHTCNQQAHALFGLDDLDELHRVSFREFLCAGAGEGNVENLLENPDDCAGYIVNRQSRLRSRSGNEFDAELAITALIDSTGKSSDFVVFVRDVSERNRISAELDLHRQHLEKLVQERTGQLADARDRLAKIIDGSPVPTLVIDANHVITHWNRACERIIGARAADMVGTRQHWKAFYPDERPILADLVMTADKATIATLYGSKCRPSQVLDGGYEAEDFFPAFGRWLFFTAAPLRDSAGCIVGAIETLQEVSERKEAELALVEAKKVAEGAAAAKSAFLANMSHEIRTPMNAVIGLAHLLIKSGLSDKQKDYVNRIQGAGKMLLGLINDVLDFSKIEAGRMRLEATEFRLDDVLNDVATVVVPHAQEKGLELQYVLEPEVPPLLIGDPLRLSQILVNLVGNAIKFTAHGSVNVLIRTESQEAGSVTLGIDIQDTGIGISEEQQRKLFHAFTQADSTITRRYGGTGLGLAICQRLVSLMGGTISVVSRSGVGSTFSFTVCLGMAAAGEKPAPQPAHHRVLVVDDNPVARVVLSRLLEKAGCTVETAESGEQALAVLEAPEAQRYDCITLDLNMPGMDGLALSHAIRGRIHPVPRLVMITASDVGSSEHAGTAEAFDAVVSKPVTAVQIDKLVADLRATAQPRELRIVPKQGAYSAPSPAVELAPLAGMRVLVAEDIDTNRLIITEILTEFGATVDTTVHGREALNRVQTPGCAYDVVLMDIQMPEMDGLEATRLIRAGHRQPNVPIVAMTAHAYEDEQRRCRSAGMNEFLTKPVDPERLRDVLLRWKPAAKPAPTGATAGAKAAEKELPPLPGIDVAEGLRRMMNKTALYERVLRDFCQRFRGEDERIAADLASGDVEAARRRAHSAKGLAGSIGANSLQETSRLLEKAITDHPATVADELAAFRASLGAIVDTIASGLQINA